MNTISKRTARLYLEGVEDAKEFPVAAVAPPGPADLLQTALAAACPAPDQVGYSPSAALLLSVTSAWAYSDAETLTAMLSVCGMSDPECHLFSVVNGALFVDAQAFFVRSTEQRVGILVFRGTEFGGVTLTDVFTDINTETVRYPDAVDSAVHGGFYRSFKYLWPKLVPTLAIEGTDEAGIDRLFIAGHSLGGALAALATCELVAGSTLPTGLRGKFCGLYTFGQPMVGNRAFAAHFEPLVGERTFRHVYQYDVVPQLPPRTTGRFSHFGTEFFGTATQTWQRRRISRQQALAATLVIPVAILAFVLRQLPAGRRLSLPVSLSDHLPQNYIDCSKLNNVATAYP
ncbi:lipase family protein [Streptomyces sp. KR55]|uniref:lipase family protein n=1 Tax=Streptomyces sp. KR55 TaxID=3457425 RepID=UPI003FD4A481